jgi:hypothetical protein
MLLRGRPTKIETRVAETAPGFEHVDPKSIAVIRWLQAGRIEFVLVGPVAEAIRGQGRTSAPVAIVPAPYVRNYERLARALWSSHARLRIDVDTHAASGADTMPVKMTGEKFARGQRWTFRVDAYDLDVEGHPPDDPGYQELLYEASRFDVAEGVAVEVASPEDIEHYAHLKRTGTAPEIRISRSARVEQD